LPHHPAPCADEGVRMILGCAVLMIGLFVFAAAGFSVAGWRG